MDEETVNALTDAASALSKAASEISIATSNIGSDTAGFLSWGQVSFGALFGSILGALIAFFVRRWFAKKDDAMLAAKELKNTAIKLHDRFNSREVLEARSEAEEFLLQHAGEKFKDIRDEDVRINSVWLVAREYEFMSIAAIDEEIADKDIIAKYAFEIFVYWLQHFRYGFEGADYDTVKRIKALEDYFKNNEPTKDRWEETENKQRAHINSLLTAAGKPNIDFTTAPPLIG